MKKIYLALAFSSTVLCASAQCIVDTTAQTRPGISPAPESSPCIERSAPYSQTLQVMCPTYYDSVINLGITSYPVMVTIDSMELTNVTGLPAGITWSKNPSRLYGGQNGCITFSGTTSAPVGPYNLGWYGTVWASLPSQIPAQYRNQTYTGNLNKYTYVDYYFNVINQGDSCRHFKSWPAGVNEANAELASAFQVYPNPNNGSFEISVNAVKGSPADVEIIDMTGRTIHTQSVNINSGVSVRIDLNSYEKGLYIVRLKTADAVAAKTISVE